VSELNERIMAVLRTRTLAQRTLGRALDELLRSGEPISETLLRDTWLAYLREDPRVYTDGWYTPPPHGLIVVFATDQDASRVNLNSFRPEEAWPRDDILLDRNHGIILVHASPVDKATGMIGDFGATLYFGGDPDVQNHLVACLRINEALFKQIKSDWTMRQIAEHGAQELSSAGLVNEAISKTDSGLTNMGHTIPGLADGWTASEAQTFHKGRWREIKDVISKKRLFVKANEQSTVRQVVVFTIEPRAHVSGRPNLPVGYFHTIAVFHDGEEQLVTGFDTIFRLAGMGYMVS
jgi:hypothetical protein